MGAEPGIEDVAQPVAEEVEAQHDDHDREAGEDRQPRADVDIGSRGAQHAAPGSLRRLRAEPEEAERRLGQDRDRQVDGDEHEQRRPDVGDHVTQHDPQAARSERPRRLGVRIAHHLEHGAPDDPRERRQDHDPDRDHRVAAVRPEQAGDHDREHDSGQREHDVDEPHQHRVDDPLVVAGQQAEHDPADEGDRHRDRADLKGHLRPVDDARHRVAPELVRAHRVSPARPLEAEGGQLVRVEPPDVGPDQGHEDVEDDDEGAGEPDRVAPLAEEGEAPSRHRLPDGRHSATALGRQRRLGSSSARAHSWEILGSRTP